MVGLDPVIEAPSAPLPRAPAPRIDSELGPAEPAAIAAAATLQPREVPQERSVPPVAQPLGFLREQPPPRRELLAGVSWKIALGVGGVIALAVVAVLVLRGRSRGVGGGAIVQVISQDGPSGAGFFVDGPDDAAYVATAFHLVASGSPISVRRWITPGGGAAYAEAFPELDVVATDPGSDLAVLRLRGVPKKRVETLALAAQAQVGASVRAHGFAARARGPAAREGTIARADKLPSFDQRKPGAIDALLVSGELEPGFSGGPALDARGEVVGVGLTKDQVYQGPTALVNVASLRQLLATVVRAGADAPLTAEAVQRFLVRVEVEYLMLALGERPTAPLYEYLARGDLPRIHALASAVRRQGAVSVALIPGRLETFHDRPVQDGLRKCATEGPRRLLEPLACAHLADAPLAWDFAAAALRWEGKTRPLQVTKLEEVDPASHLHRAEISGAGPSALTIYLAMEQGRPRLSLFDGAGEPYWIEREKGSAEAFAGRWVQRGKGDDGRAKAAARRCEEVVVASREGSLAVTYTLEREARGAGERATRRKGARAVSPARSLVQVEYTGQVSQEDAVLLEQRRLSREGSCDASLCALEPTSLVLKRVGEGLHAYRTGVDGTIEISPLRKTGEGCSSPAAVSDVGPKAKKGKKARGGHPAGAAAPANRGGGKAKGGKRGRI